MRRKSEILGKAGEIVNAIFIVVAYFLLVLVGLAIIVSVVTKEPLSIKNWLEVIYTSAAAFVILLEGHRMEFKNVDKIKRVLGVVVLIGLGLKIWGRI